MLKWHFGTTNATRYVDISMPGYVKNSSTNSTTKPLNAYKTHHILPRHQCLATNHRNYHWLTCLLHSIRWAKNASSKLWALSSFMLEQLTTLPAINTITWYTANATNSLNSGPLNFSTISSPIHCNYLLLRKRHGSQSA